MNWTLTFGIIAGIVVIVAAIFQWKDKKEDDEKNERIHKRNEKLQLEILESSKELRQAQKDLKEANVKIFSLQQKTNELLTGGDSFCVIEPSFNQGRNNDISFSIRMIGNNPLYTVTLSIQDIERRGRMYKQENIEFNGILSDETKMKISEINTETQYDIPNIRLYLNSQQNIPIIFEKSQTDFQLWIWIFAPNGTFYENLEIKNYRSDNRVVNLNVYDLDNKLIYSSKPIPKRKTSHKPS